MRTPSLILKRATYGLLIWLCFMIWSSFSEDIVTSADEPQILYDNASLSDGDKVPKTKHSEELEEQTNVDSPVSVEVATTLESILEQSASSQNANGTDSSLVEEAPHKSTKTESDPIEQAAQPSHKDEEKQPISPDDVIPRVHQLKDLIEGGAGDQAEKLSDETRTNATSEDQAADISVAKLEETNETFAHNIMIAENVSEDSVGQAQEDTVQPESDEGKKVEVTPLSIFPSAEEKESTLFKEDSTPMKPGLEPVEDMPSFDEWKKKMLAEQEKSKQNDQIGHNNIPVPSKIKQQSKNRNNYASIDCGAKILAINSEAQSASSILIENRDEYMLNPCKAKIWFIVELCEPIQLKLFEIANFELFSSTPQVFRAFSSDRYPTRDWTLLNTFHARDERAVQQFSLNEQIFIKYFKIEMLSHFGSEHYCPLSLLRVYGTSMVEEYEDSQSDHHTPDTYNEDLDVDLERDKNEVPKNLFGSAKDAVLSIVKKAASALTGEKQANAAKGNESSNANLTEEEPGEDKGSNVEEPLKEKKKSVCEQSANLGSTLYYPHTPGAAIPTCQLGARTESADKNLSVTSSIHSVTSKSARSLLEDCTLCEPIQNVTENHTVYDLWSTCTYMKTLLSVTHNVSNCCPSGKNYRQHYPMDSVCAVKGSDSLCNFGDVLPTRMPKYVPSGTQNTAIGQFMTASTSMNVQIPSYSKTIDNSYMKKSSYEEDLNDLTLSVHGTSQIDTSMIQPTATMKEFDVKEADTKEGLKSSEQEEILSSGSLFEEIAVGTIEEKQLSNLELATDPILVTETAQLSLSNASLEKELDDAILGDLNLPAVDFTNISSSIPSIDATTPSETQQIDTSNEGDMLNLSALAVGETRSTINGHGAPFISSSQKESVFMRLNNRIKALELNMSLSGQYLEELSRRYRKQMEEMQRAFNKTIGALNETAKKAHQMDLKQQEVIAILEARLENLTTAVVTLVEEQQTLHRQVIDRHLFFMMLEVIFMLIFIVICLWKNVPHDVFNNMRNLSVPSRTTSSRKTLKRRSSNDGTIGHNSPENSSLKRRLSEDAFTGEPTPELLIVQPSIPILVEVPPKLAEGKRKKHHSKLRNKAKSAINLQQSTAPPLQQKTNSTRVTAAGFLFGASIIDDASSVSSSGALTASSSILENCSSTIVSNSKTSSKQSIRSSLSGSLKSNSSNNKNNNRASLESKDSLKVQIIGSLLNGTCNGHIGSGGVSQPKKEKS